MIILERISTGNKYDYETNFNREVMRNNCKFPTNFIEI